jgi:hypothetical protein
MGGMGNIAPGLRQSQIQFDGTITDNKIFGFYRDRRKKKHQLGVWEEDSEGKQNTEDCPEALRWNVEDYLKASASST